jgi:hypothetical protein
VARSDVEVVYLCVAGEAIANKSFVVIRSISTCHVKRFVPQRAISDVMVHVNCIGHVLSVVLPPATECTQAFLKLEFLSAACFFANVFVCVRN